MPGKNGVESHNRALLDEGIVAEKPWDRKKEVMEKEAVESKKSVGSKAKTEEIPPYDPAK